MLSLILLPIMFRFLLRNEMNLFVVVVCVFCRLPHSNLQVTIDRWRWCEAVGGGAYLSFVGTTQKSSICVIEGESLGPLLLPSGIVNSRRVTLTEKGHLSSRARFVCVCVSVFYISPSLFLSLSLFFTIIKLKIVSECVSECVCV